MRISDWSSDVCSSDLNSASPGRIIIRTRMVAVIIQAVSPLSTVGAASCAQAGSAVKSATPKPATLKIFQPGVIASPLFLKRIVVGLAGPDAHRAADIEDEDLAVADRAGGRRGLDRLDDAIRDIGGADDLDLDLGHHVGGV